MRDEHLELAARLRTPEAGLPRRRSQHLAVRTVAGVFDLSHMGRLDVRGKGAADYLQALLTNDVGQVEPGRAQYTLLCREDGGILK